MRRAAGIVTIALLIVLPPVWEASVAAVAPQQDPPAAVPAFFGKTGPVNGSTGQGLTVTLAWQASPGATSYEYCIDPVPTGSASCYYGYGGAGNALSATVSGLVPGIRYSWQVYARNSEGVTAANDGMPFNFRVAGRRVRGDFDGDGLSDLVLFRNGLWLIRNQPDRSLGLPGDVPVPGDYDGDGRTEPAVFRPSTGEWFIDANPPVQFGLSGDKPLPADYDGNGTTDIAVLRDTGSTTEQSMLFVRGQFTRPMGPSFGGTAVAGDFDGDGRADVVFNTGNSWSGYFTAKPGLLGDYFFFGQAGGIPMPGDYDGDGRLDIASYHAPSLEWTVLLSSSRLLERVSFDNVPVPGLDVDGDGADDFVSFHNEFAGWKAFSRTSGTLLSFVQHGQMGDVPAMQVPRLPSTPSSRFTLQRFLDLTIFRPSSGHWYSREITSPGFTFFTTQQWGLPGDVPIDGDFDGDGRSDYAVYRPSNGHWFLKSSSIHGVPLRIELWGQPGAVPVAADYDGDSRTDLAFYRPADGTWFVRLSSTNYAAAFSMQWGLPGDVPVQADYDGDGRADIAVFRPSSGEWFLRLTGNRGPFLVRTFGQDGDIPVRGDFDGNGQQDLAVYRPSTGTWYAADTFSGDATLTKQWGLPGDIPVPGLYYGGWPTAVAVYRPSTGQWFATSPYAQTLVFQWGAPGDRPLTQPNY